MSGFEKIVTVEPAYDRRDEGYGIGGCRLRFVLKGPNGVVQFLIGTEWFTPSARQHLLQFPHTTERALQMKPDGWDVGYHSPKSLYEGQTPMESCDLLPEGSCYYDGSGLRADEWVEPFVAGGTDWLWPKLEEEYRLRFECEAEVAA